MGVGVDKGVEGLQGKGWLRDECRQVGASRRKQEGELGW